MRTTTILLSMILLISLVGCSGDEPPTALTGTPTHEVTKADGTHGAQIVRYEDAIAVLYYDLERELQLLVGVDIEEYCNVGYFPDFVNIMEVTNPVDQDIVFQLLHGRDLRAAVFPLYPFDCARFVGEGPIASGLVNMVSTDNDLYAWAETNDNPRVNSYMTSANGTLYTPDGGKVLLNFTWKVVWPGYPDFDQVRELRSDIHMAFTGN